MVAGHCYNPWDPFVGLSGESLSWSKMQLFIHLLLCNICILDCIPALFCCGFGLLAWKHLLWDVSSLPLHPQHADLYCFFVPLSHPATEIQGQWKTLWIWGGWVGMDKSRGASLFSPCQVTVLTAMIYAWLPFLNGFQMAFSSRQIFVPPSLL